MYIWTSNGTWSVYHSVAFLWEITLEFPCKIEYLIEKWNLFRIWIYTKFIRNPLSGYT